MHSILLMAIRRSLIRSLGLLSPTLKLLNLFIRGRRALRSKRRGPRVTADRRKEVTLKSQWNMMTQKPVAHRRAAASTASQRGTEQKERQLMALISCSKPTQITFEENAKRTSSRLKIRIKRECLTMNCDRVIVTMSMISRAIDSQRNQIKMVIPISNHQN